ncbi:MAG: hypothetical protein LBV42_03570 [Methanobrevibacter sp.]|jgi:hypothetical protein|nr:hypothetical protein [Methanobrevibacter sp.]
MAKRRKIKKIVYKNNNLKKKEDEIVKKSTTEVFQMDEEFVSIISRDNNSNKKPNNHSPKAKKQLEKHRLKIGFMEHNLVEEYCMQAKKVKKQYSSENEAKKDIDRFKKEDWGDYKKPNGIYYCHFCNCWHSTSK